MIRNPYAFDAVGEYAASVSSPPPDYLVELERETFLKMLSPQMISGAHLGRFISFISKLVHPKRVVEIGTFTGYSALCLWEGLAEDGKIETIETNPECLHLARKYFDLAGATESIEILEGDAKTILEDIEEGVDLILIDADKGEYNQYFELILPKLKQGGVVLFDNTLWSGKVLDESIDDAITSSIRTFNNKLLKDDRVENFLVPLRDGMTVTRKK